MMNEASPEVVPLLWLRRGILGNQSLPDVIACRCVNWIDRSRGWKKKKKSRATTSSGARWGNRESGQVKKITQEREARLLLPQLFCWQERGVTRRTCCDAAERGKGRESTRESAKIQRKRKEEKEGRSKRRDNQKIRKVRNGKKKKKKTHFT